MREDDVLTSAEAAAFLKVGNRTVLDEAKRGRLLAGAWARNGGSREESWSSGSPVGPTTTTSSATSARCRPKRPRRLTEARSEFRLKVGLVARDARLLAALLVLCLTAVVLVVTSWPRSDDLARPREAAEFEAVETKTSKSPVPAVGRRVARRFAEAYFATPSSISDAARRERLEPYSSDELIAEMRVNSGALALRGSRSREQVRPRLSRCRPRTAPRGTALVAIVERTTKANEKTRTELLTVTLELVEDDDEWMVTAVLVP